MTPNSGLPDTSRAGVHGSSDRSIGNWIESAIQSAPNKRRLERQLDFIRDETALIRFLHRFVLFNDALAARVPFLAGLIHLTPNLFLEPEPGVGFCRQANGRIAAFVAEAASDEYHMPDGLNMVHQYLSQRFFLGVLAHYDIDSRTFDRLFALPHILYELLAEARGKFFHPEQRGAEQIFSGLGFHIGLEFFAHQEFNVVDSYLRSCHPELVADLERRDGNGSGYLWVQLHTVVEIGHYHAGLQALHGSLKYYRDGAAVPTMVDRIKEGFNAFIDLQGRYYEAILSDAR